jgi:hypothetical protein
MARSVCVRLRPGRGFAAHPPEVSTLQESEHLAALDQARAPVGTAPADDLDIPEFLRRTPEHQATQEKYGPQIEDQTVQ